jgi:hypothetical protein
MVNLNKERMAEKLVCEGCKKEFYCGANKENCWCFEVKLKPEIMKQLRENYKSCLCMTCLEQKNHAQIKTN